MIWIGLDEAGYGPMLGPLAVGATAWRVPNGKPPDCLYERLAGIVTVNPRPLVKTSVGDRESFRRVAAPVASVALGDIAPLWIADSKLVYQTGELTALERGVLRLARIAKVCPFVNAGELLQAVVKRAATGLPVWAWDAALAVPCDFHNQAEAQSAAGKDCEHARQTFQDRECELLAIRAALLWPGEFNRALAARENNKSLVLFHTGFELLQSLIADFPDEPIWIDADKLGGRDRYGALLQHALDGEWVEVLHESGEESLYRWGTASERPHGAPRWIRYRVGGERAMPTAAASMTAKYLRELSMLAWNRFWQEELHGLRPTAGYYVDALRFLKEITQRQTELRIPAAEIVRKK